MCIKNMIKIITLSVGLLIQASVIWGTTEVLDVQTVNASGGFDYNNFEVDLTGIPVDNTDTSIYVKIANDIEASGDAAAEMPLFEVKLQRRANNTDLWGTVDTVELLFTPNSNDILTGYATVFISKELVGGDFVRRYKIRIRMKKGGWAAGQPLGTEQERLWIGVDNRHATETRSYFGTKGDSEVEAEVPWIKVVSDPVDFGEVLLGGYVKTQTLEIANVGTGTLQLNDPTLSHPAFSFAVTGLNAPYTVPPLTYLNDPNPNPEIQFDSTHSSLSPTSLGPISPTPTITFVNAPHQSDIVMNLPVTLVKGELVLLFDRSGSMTFTPDGQTTTNPADERMSKAKLAGIQLINIFQGLQSSPHIGVGLAAFPGTGFAPPSAEAIVPFANSTNVSIGPIGTHHGILIQALAGPTSVQAAPVGPLGGTPLAEGLKLAHGFEDPPNSDNYPNFGTNKWTQGEYVRRALLVLSDGWHNVDSVPPYHNTQEWIQYLNTIKNDPNLENIKIRVYTIAYGVPNTLSVDKQTLIDLAANSDGMYHDADSTNYGDLPTTFLNALREFLELDLIVDPEGILTENEPTKSHDVCIDNSVRQVAFVVNWEKPSPDAVEFKLRGPVGVISESSPDVTYHANETYALYIVKGPTAKGQQGSDKWTLELSRGPGLNAGESVNYNYSVICNSNVKMSILNKAQLFYTGKNKLFEVKIDGLTRNLAKSVNVTLEYEIPKNSIANWSSIMEDFDPHWLVHPQPSKPHAPETIMGEMATMLQRKVYSLENFAKKIFVDTRAKGTLQLHDDGMNGDKTAGDRIYSAYLPTLNRDGTAKFGAILQNNSDENNCLRRELRMDKLIRINLDPQILAKNVKFLFPQISLFFPDGISDIIEELKKEYQVRSIEFTPQDKFGNRLGPGKLDQIKFTLKNAQAVGDIVDNMNGEYVQVIKFKKGDVPSVIVTARGVTSPEIELKPFTGVRWGLKGGLNFANLTPSGTDTPDFDWKNKTGFCAGAFVAFYLFDNLAIQPELLFSRKGLKVDQVTGTDTFNVDSIDVPLLLKFNLSPSGPISPCLFSGPFASFKINDNIVPGTGVPPIKNFDYGITIGAGFDINLGSTSALILEGRYSWGFPNIADVPAGSNVTVRSKVLSLLVGLQF